MTVTIPKTKYCGTVSAPPSKSAAHRHLIGAGLAEGTSVIRGISESEDMKATLDCLRALGATWTKNGDTVTIIGADPRKRAAAVFPCRESGSTLRFFLPLCLLSEKEAVMTGSETLLHRPLGVYEDICLSQGLLFEHTEDGLTVAGPLDGGHFRVAGNISSQFISGLMFALPLLSGYSVIELIPPVMSASYLAMTVEALRHFGITCEVTSDERILLPGNQNYRAADHTVEGDWSNAAFFLALNALGSELEIEGLRRDTLQGDAVIRRLLGKLGRGCPTIDIADCPDLAPILMATAAALHGVRLIHTDRLKLKESDRGAAMAEELAKFGVAVTIGDDWITVEAPKTLQAPQVPIAGHNDHRIVMACAVLLTCVGGVIEGAEAVKKSFPDFFEVLQALQPC
ncbi:MAG: 3-phosphoshikimate 1-carboxyvinyltransferase [Ruminococcaceae bacterium]|nr:3-phosphoshikimate 1-carboxyvinyltransferase [Oscillospiraceae bacterium]